MTTTEQKESPVEHPARLCSQPKETHSYQRNRRQHIMWKDVESIHRKTALPP